MRPAAEFRKLEQGSLAEPVNLTSDIFLGDTPMSDLKSKYILGGRKLREFPKTLMEGKNVTQQGEREKKKTSVERGDDMVTFCKIQGG